MTTFGYILIGVWGLGTVWAWLQGIACWVELNRQSDLIHELNQRISFLEVKTGLDISAYQRMAGGH